MDSQPAANSNRDWKAELKRIVEFLSYNGGDNDDSEALWSVLTALRGPDEDDRMEVLKRSTTAVIRHAIGLYSLRVIVEPDADRHVDVRRMLLDGTGYAAGHFAWHAKQAFDELGLKWDENNSTPSEQAKERTLRVRYIDAQAAVS